MGGPASDANPNFTFVEVLWRGANERPPHLPHVGTPFFRAILIAAFREPSRVWGSGKKWRRLKSSLVEGQGSNAASLPRELTAASYS
jgi:hypothetical protein